jgi:hypothetical protein
MELTLPTPTQRFVIKASDESVTSSDVAQDDDELLFAVLAGEKWTAEFELYYDAGTAGDIYFGIGVPAGTTGRFGVVGPIVAATSENGDWRSRSLAIGGGALGVGGIGAGTVTCAKVTVSLTVGGTAGNVVLQWAQNASSATASILKAGSFLVARRLPF